MKVNNSLKPAATSGVKDIKARARTSRAPSGSGGSRESVQIQPRAAQLAALEAGLDNVDTIDSARVDEIRLAISEGRFEINAEAVASRLLDAAKEHLLKGGR